VRKVRGYSPFLFLLPALVLLGLFTYYPIGYSFFHSLHLQNFLNPKPVFAGFENYRRMLNDPIFWTVVKNNLIYSLLTIFPTMALALFLAILIDESKRFKTFFKIGLFYPMLIPTAAGAMVWVLMFDPSLGLINKVLRLFGLPQPGWLGSSDYSLWGLIIMGIWKDTGYYMLIFLAGLQNIPIDLYEAASIEGANWWKKHLFITIPLVSPTTLFVFVVAVIQSFKVFTQVHLMTKGGPGYSSNVLVYYTYENAFRYWDIGLASALTCVLILFLILLVMLIFGFLARKVHYSLV